MYNLSNLTITDIVACRNLLREIGKDARSMEDVAERIARLFYREFADENQQRACSLVRVYKTVAYGDLDTELRKFADSKFGDFPKTDQTRCLTLLATAGEQANWNSRKHSLGHQTIPLPCEDMINKLPMISQLIKQLGIELYSLLKPDASILVDNNEKLYNVFYIQNALGSPHIPAQREFVIPYNIKSVVGFGTLLPANNLVVTILFLKVQITQETAELFKTLALGTKLAVLPFINGKVFNS